MKPFLKLAAAVAIVILLCSSNALGLDVDGKLNIEGDIAGVYQYQNISDAPDVDDTGRGAVLFQPTIRFQLTEHDVVSAKFGFAAGDALNDTSPFMMLPWATDLEADVKDISGRSRDYLLTAWYSHSFDSRGAGTLDLTGGIIDATEFLDTNAYANDGLTQFMNAALVNGPVAFLPSYDLGAAAQWELGNWSAAAAYMSVAENDDDQSYRFIGLQAGYRLMTGLGEGNYRLMLTTTTEDFSRPDGSGEEALTGIMISCDQQLGEVMGGWVRIGWQDDSALVDYQELFSGGVNVKGDKWGRSLDHLGLGFAHLSGGNSAIDHSSVIELYYRLVFTEIAALTLDFQYLIDNYNTGDDPKGLVSGIRFVASF